MSHKKYLFFTWLLDLDKMAAQDGCHNMLRFPDETFFKCVIEDVLYESNFLQIKGLTLNAVHYTENGEY